MPDRASASIHVAATPAEVLNVVADFAAYPDWVSSVRQAEVLTVGADGRPAEVRLVIDGGLIRDDYVLAYTWGEQEVSWHLVRGQMQKSQEGSYQLTPQGGGTLVRYELSVELGIPVPGMLKRRAERVVMDAALKDLKQRVER